MCGLAQGSRTEDYQPVVFVIGVAAHQQVRCVVAELRNLGCDVVLLDPLSAQDFSIEMGSESSEPEVRCGGRSAAVADLVWYADKPMVPPFGTTQEWADSYADSKAWKAAIANLMHVSSAEVVNDPCASERCHWKLWQLSVARRAGFAVPWTLLTNTTARLRSGLEEGARFIAKATADPYLPRIGAERAYRVVMTNEVSAVLLADRPEVEPHPTKYQVLVDKKAEHRVIVVDQEVFAFRIDPRQHPIMEIDYRRGGFAVRYEPEDLGEAMIARILTLHADFGLFSGCYDFIEEPDGRFVFLEVNPEGMWALHDDLLDGRISRAFAKALGERAASAAVMRVSVSEVAT